MRLYRLALVVAVAGCNSGTGACSFYVTVPGPPPAEVAAAPATPHGDHSPHHGGVVMMKGDLHYEIVLDPSGRHRIYFTDAARGDLPASTASRASITLLRPDEPPEGVSLEIDEAGESWIGQGRPVTNPATTRVRIGYTLRGEEPYWIDLPFIPERQTTDPHARPAGR